MENNSQGLNIGNNISQTELLFVLYSVPCLSIVALLEFEGTPDYKKREKGEIKYNFPRKQSKSRKARQHQEQRFKNPLQGEKACG